MYLSIYPSLFLKMISVIPLATVQDQLPQCLQGLILGHLNGGNWWLNQEKYMDFMGFNGI